MRRDSRVSLRIFAVLSSLLLFGSLLSLAQTSQASITLGGPFSPDVKQGIPGGIATNTIHIHTGFSFQGTFARRIASFDIASLSVELPVLMAPNRGLDNGFPQPGPNFSSLFVTPSLSVSFLARRRISPFVSAGAGFVYFGHTDQPNVTAAGQVGGGLEFKTPFSRLSIRTEVRDYISGNPRIAELFFGLHGDTTSTLYAGGGATFHF